MVADDAVKFIILLLFFINVVGSRYWQSSQFIHKDFCFDVRLEN